MLNFWTILFSAVVLSMWSIRRYFAGGWCYSMTRLHGKTVIVTGANSGIGRETARDLARRGARVILACRDLEKAEAAIADIRTTTSKGELVAYLLDLASFASIRAFAEKFKQYETGLDILINNAGVMMCPELSTKDGYELQLGVNHLGPFLLTNLLLDRLKSSSPSRIINVSSISHALGKIHWEDLNMTANYNRLDAYGQSKLAVILFTTELSRRIEGTGVTANCLHPGVVKNDLFRHMTAAKAEGIVWFLMQLVGFLPGILFKNSEEGAQTTIYCAVATELAEISGLYFADCAPRKPMLGAEAEKEAQKLWDLSSKIVGLEERHLEDHQD